MRKRTNIVVCIVCISSVLLFSLKSARAMGGEYGKGDPKHPISNSAWPKGLEAVANRADRIGGYWVNANDTLFYAGDSADFNGFLKEYSRVESKSLTLIIDNSAGATGLFQTTDTNSNWQLATTGWSTSTATVTIPLHGRIAIRNLKVPLNVTVYTFGEKDRNAEEFVAAHNAAMEKASKK